MYVCMYVCMFVPILSRVTDEYAIKDIRVPRTTHTHTHMHTLVIV